jgi:hypothetical protein
MSYPNQQAITYTFFADRDPTDTEAEGIPTGGEEPTPITVDLYRYFPGAFVFWVNSIDSTLFYLQSAVLKDGVDPNYSTASDYVLTWNKLG